jgi:DNA-binding beta-propeller fold protein YncE
MKTIASVAAVCAALALTAIPASANGPQSSYRVSATMKSASGPVQALRSDAASRRLFVASKGAIEVFDIDTDRKLGQVDTAGDVAGIAIAPDLQQGFASSPGDNSITVFDLKTFKAVATLKPVGSEPGAIEYEPRSKRLFVSNQKGGVLTVVDAEKGRIVGTVKLGGRLRGLAADSRGHVFVADQEQNVLHVVDAAGLKAVGTMPVWPASQPTGVLLDNKERRIYVASASGRMVVLDPDIGQVVGHVPTGKGDSGIAAQFLPNRLVRLFVPSGDGQLTVVQNIKLNAYVEATVPAAGIQPNAVAADVKTGKAYVAGPSEVLVLTRGAAGQNMVINK